MGLQRSVFFGLAQAALLAVVLMGCGGGGSTVDERPPQSCTTSADCDGLLCVAEQCRPCVEDSFCAQDSEYGVGATCNSDGTCGSCLGEEGCGCDGDTCQDGLSCTDGVCEQCPDGAEGCACFRNGTCDAELRCNNEVCEPCPSGDEGCACLDGEACNGELVCMEGRCAVEECELGAQGCPCREGEEGRCDEGLTCTDSDMCAECSSDIEGCPCDENDECQNDLVCDDEEKTCRPAQACADLGCVENQLCEDEAPGVDARCLEECAEGFIYVQESRTCEPIPDANCNPDAPGSILEMCGAINRRCELNEQQVAACTTCLPGFLDEDGQPGGNCRAVVTCDGLNCAQDNRDCIPNTDDADATCGGCTMGFRENNGVCEPEPQANCQPGAELSILVQCNEQSRLCVENDNGAECGGCVEGFAEDPNTQQCTRRLCIDINCAELGRECDGEPLAECGGCREGLIPVDANNPQSACRETTTCNDITCEDGQFCVERDGQDAQCSTWPCLDVNNDPDLNQAYSDFAGGCVDCGLVCGARGETGRIWPFTLDRSNRCVCETEPGFFVDEAGAFVARPCDDDNDGWVRESARNAVESQDQTLRVNARCDVREVDRFVLQNEFRQTLDVKLCVEGIVGSFACEADADCEVGRCNEGSCDCIEPSPVALYETVRNDDQGELDTANNVDAPAYLGPGVRGRRLLAGEVNPLTRACISATGDYNDNNVADITEYQGMALENATPEEQIFMTFAHFIEIHEGGYERLLGDEFGRYVIKERSRCEQETFPVQYDEVAGDYWRSCTRNRDADFDRLGDNALIGYDFAHWSCPEGAETCDFPPPPIVTGAVDEIPNHGICEEGVVLPPVDGVWRGMNHHSQFKCVQVVNELPENRDATAPHQRQLNDLSGDINDGRALKLNQCFVACPPGDLDCAQDCDGGVCNESSLEEEGNPNRPVVQCVPVDRPQVVEGQVGFAAVRYLGPEAYNRGCISEYEPTADPFQADAWNSLCPGFVSRQCGVFDPNFDPLSNAPEDCGVAGGSNPGNFGKLVCGCGFEFGGIECDRGCAGDMLFYGGTHQGDAGCDPVSGYCPVSPEGDGGRRGFWVCGSWSTTSTIIDPELGPDLISEQGWSASGEVPNNGIRSVIRCQNPGDCSSGWSAQ